MNFRYFLFAISFILFSACEKTEKVDNFPKHESKLVTNCFFYPDTCFVFNLSKSLSPIDNAPFKNMNSSNAYIRVFENNILFDSFRYNGPSKPVFAGTKFPKANNTYRFECNYPGFGIVKAEDYIPDTFKVKKLSGYYTVIQSYSSTDTMLWGDYSTNINIDLESIQGKNQYLILYYNYLPVLLKNDSRYGGYYYYIPEITDLNTTNSSEFIGSRLFVSNPNGIEKLNIKWMNEYTRLYKNRITNHYYFTIISCSEATFEYLKRQALQIENENDPFAAPTPISNNIINGYGIFGGLNVQYCNIAF